ncbi:MULTISPECIES: ScpA family protein [Brucella/Ochrobactrum group]|uniref:segregation and condensation protein A n=1 Tax=Brucella/Ochrobactrum group TaxID=2826938 RepID=UPI001656590E|nr:MULTISPECIES: ScpA family protein [Brucella/Ochrobactrum group]MBC8717574.1 segregation/condensation protein A [Ochrobactrum sp. Marseille-Q0166]
MAGSETNTSSKDGANVPMDALWQEESERDDGEPSLLIDVQGFEGPLDLLLHLARNQRVDLSRISVLALAEQYLAFVEQAQALKLELAADYLVMAAWLAYLKSKLLIPKQKGDDEATGEELLATLQFRLKRLEAMRDAAANLVNRKRLGRDVFARGMPELVVVDRSSQFSATLYELLTAYASQRQRQSVTHVQIEKRAVWSLKEARSALVRLMGVSEDWISLDRFLINYALTPQERASALASSFAASLELVREGKLELRQNAAFEPIYMRAQAQLNELDEDGDV